MEDVVPVVVRLLRVSPGDDQLLPGRVDAEVHGDVTLSLQESVLSLTEIRVTAIISSSIQYPACSGFSLIGFYLVTVLEEANIALPPLEVILREAIL